MVGSLAALYERGAHREVWEELVAIGPGVLDPSVRPEAERVAELTMRRAAANVAVLSVRLTALGYRFGARHRHNRRRQAIEDLGLRDSMADAGRDVGWIDAGVVEEHVMGWAPPGPAVADDLATLERRLGPLPLSLAAAIRVLDAVDLSGSFPGWEPPAFAFEDDEDHDDGDGDGAPGDGHDGAPGDGRRGPRLTEPLNLLGVGTMLDLTAPADALDADVTAPVADLGADAAMAVPVAADARLAANVAGDYHHVLLPEAVADPVLLGVPGHEGIRLVEYLRRAFAWGGFPGFEGAATVPPELDLLRRDLLPL